MKSKLWKITSVIMMLLVMVIVTGCSKSKVEQATDTSTVEENKEEAPTVDTSVEEKLDEATPTPEEVAEEKTEPTPTPTQTPALPTDILANINLEGGIKDVYAQFGLNAGTCLSDVMISDSKYTDIIKANFNQITLENLMKPDYILNQEKSIKTGELTVEFTKMTKDLLDWAKNNDMKVRGHVLIWYSQTPDWIFYKGFDKTKGLVDRDTMLGRMESYIKQTFELLDTLGYSDIFYSYDIVNEALLDDGSYRDCLWKQVIGEDYVWHAFNFADKYAPEHIKLYYNDFNEQFKTTHFVKLAKSLVTEDGRSLIDGLGCQGHLYTKDSIDKYMSMLQVFSTLGLEVQITELDVSLGTWQKIEQPTEDNLTAQGKYYYELISKIIRANADGKANVSAITFWGFTDELSWRRDRNPVLFDKNLAPKFAYHGAKLDRANAGYDK